MKNIRKILKSLTAVLTVIAVTFGFSGCKEKYTEKTSFAMGSVLDIKIMSDDEEVCEELFTLLINAVNETDLALSATKDGAEIKKLNEQGQIAASGLLQDILQDTVMLCNTLERKVDITMGKVTELWGFSTDDPSVPSAADIKSALETVNIEQILIDTERGSVSVSQGAKLDIGAFGKGAACDTAFKRAANFRGSFIMTLGGTVFAYGAGPSDGKWTIGIRDPFGDANTSFATAALSTFSPKNALFVSTSGSYEKTFTENGVQYHHILDSKTGYPVETDLVSVTVTAASGLNSDALSTFCFINGLNDETLSTLTSFGAEAVFVFGDKTYYITDGLKDSVTVQDSSFTEREYNNE